MKALTGVSLVLLFLGDDVALALAEGRIGSLPLFMNVYPAGRIVLAAGPGKDALFLLSTQAGTVSRIDPFTGRGTVVLSGLSRPQDLAIGREGRRILVDLDASRTLLVALLKRAGPPLALSIGLNPGQILKGPDGRFYVTARAVHILYRLDPDRFATLDWLAVGDIFRRVSFGPKQTLWLPLFRSGQLMEVGLSPFESQKTLPIPECDHPVRVFPLPDGGFVAGCRNALVRVDGEGTLRRTRFSRSVRHPLRDMLLLPGGKRLLLIFKDDRTLRVIRTGNLSESFRLRLPYRPVRLYTFSRWPILYAVLSDRVRGETWLSAYPLRRPRLAAAPGPPTPTPIARKSP